MPSTVPIFDFSDRRFVVTGASSGIGREVARQLALSHGHVLAMARRAELLASLAQEFPQRIVPCVADVTDTAAFKPALLQFAGGAPLAGSVHAAGINRFAPLRAFQRSEAERIMATSLWAGVDLVRLLCGPELGTAGASHILLASVSGLKGQAGLTAYGATKAAVIHAVRSLARELAGKKIRINAVSPGWIPTEMTEEMQRFYPGGAEKIVQEHPLGLGTPRDVALLALYLLSDAAQWITGSNFVIDGGYSA